LIQVAILAKQQRSTAKTKKPPGNKPGGFRYSFTKEENLFVRSFRATGTSRASVSRRTRRRLVAIALIIPATTLESETGLRNQLGHVATAFATLREGIIRKLLASFKNQSAILALIFIHWHFVSPHLKL
jgi:hypothetical protein